MIPTFIGITLVAFAITRFVPGGPLERLIMQSSAVGNIGPGGGSSSGPGSQAPLSEEQLAELAAFYGFDKPWYESYLEWLGKTVTFDLGYSTRYYDPVWDLIVERLPIATYYGLMTTLLTYLICVPLGIIKAIRHKSIFDNISSVVVFVGYAIPPYVVGIILMVTLAANANLFPLGGFHSNDFETMSFGQKVIDILYYSALPLAAYVAGSFAVMTFMMKNSLMEQLHSDYVRTAMAKGVSFKKAVSGHALRNSLIPLATHFGQNISLFLTGSFLIEKIFNIDGLGLLGYESLVERDYPVVLGTLVVSSVLYLLGNILSDFCVALVDPRVQY